MIEFNYSLEFYFYVFIYFNLFTFILNRLLAKFIFFIIVSCFYIVFSLRSPKYNLDNYYYNQMFDNYDLSVLLSWLVKLEPLHYFLRGISSSFNAWLFFEAIIFILCAYSLLRRVGFVNSILVHSFSLPLYTSSFRFSLAILIISVFSTFFRRDIIIAFFGSLSHLISLSLIIRKYPLLLGASVFLTFLFPDFIPIQIRARMPDFTELSFNFGGVKTLLHVLTIAVFLRFLKAKKILPQRIELMTYAVLYALTILVSTLFNRALIVAAVTILLESDIRTKQVQIKSRFNTIFFVQLVWLIFVIGPSLLLLAGINENPNWEMYN